MEKINMNDGEILNFLLSQKIDPDWKKFLTRLVSIADECNKTLWKIMLVPEYHEYQKSKKSKSFEFNEVFEQVSRFMKDNQINDIKEAFDYILESAPKSYPGDSFFYPGLLIDQDHKYYNNNDALTFLKELLLTTKFKPECKKLMGYSLALKKAFALLAQKKYPKLDLILILWERLHVIKNIIDDEWSILLERERERIRNRKNRLNVTPFRLNKIKSHEKYPQLKILIEQYQGNTKEKKEIDQIISEIVITRSQTTIRRYRGLLIQEFQK